MCCRASPGGSRSSSCPSPTHDDQLNHVTVDNVGRDAGAHRAPDHRPPADAISVFVGDTTGSTSTPGSRDSGRRCARPDCGFRGSRSSAGWVIATRGGRHRRRAAGRGACPQALVCATDQDALAVMDALRRAGVAVPARCCGHRLRRHRRRADRPPAADHRAPAHGADGPRRGRHPDRPARSTRVSRRCSRQLPVPRRAPRKLRMPARINMTNATISARAPMLPLGKSIV